MPLRVYNDLDGDEWRVWLVMPTGAGVLDASFREGWLCFERTDGTDRRRLSMSRVPAAWDVLHDEGLDLLRRIAEPVGRRSGSVKLQGLGDHGALEDAPPDRRSSGPKSVIGGDEDADDAL
jgi:hypothetical protein